MIRGIMQSYGAGVRWWDALFLESRSLPVSFRNNRLYSVKERSSAGYGVRVNVDGTTGLSFSNDKQALAATIGRAVAAAPFGDRDDFTLPGLTPPVTVEPHADCFAGFDTEREIDKCRSVIEEIRSSFPDAEVDVGVTASEGSKKLINSEGLECAYRYSWYGCSISATLVSPDGTRLSVGESSSSLGPAAPDQLVVRLLWKMRAASVVRKGKSGIVRVLCTPKAAASLLGLLVPGLSAKAVCKGISPFVGRCGQQVFNECFTLRDDPLIPGSVHSYPFDDEGVDACSKALIERGVLRGFVSDLKYAARLGVPPSGNGSRGYSSLPSPSFSAIVIDRGTGTLEEMIAELGDGILVDQFIGLGQSNTLTGDFSANLDLAYLVKGGEIAGRIKDCMVSGNLFEVLKQDIIPGGEAEWQGSFLVPGILLPSVSLTA